MIGLKQCTGLLLGAVVAGALLVNAGTTYASVDKCQSAIESAAATYQGAVYKALKACADGVQKARVAGKAYATAAPACEKALAGVYNVNGALAAGKSAAEKLQAAITKAFTPVAPKAATCTDNDLVQLSHQVSGASTWASAPGANVQDFLVSYELMAQETAAVQQEVAEDTTLFALINLAMNAIDSAPGKQDATQCGVCNLEANECAGGTHHPCSSNAQCNAWDKLAMTGSGAARPNLCSWAPSCLVRSCQTGGATGSTLLFASAGIPGGVPLSFPMTGQQTLGVCEVAPASTVGYGQGATAYLAKPTTDVPPGPGLLDAKELYIVGNASATLAPIELLPNATVCVFTLGMEGFCDCTGIVHHGKANISFCQDRLATGKNPDSCGNVPVVPTGFPGNPDPDFPGTLVGFQVPTFTTATTNGDCMVLETTQFKILDPTASPTEYGPDGIPCTMDDLKAPAAASTLPLTTGTAAAHLKNDISGTAYGACPGDSTVECVDGGGCKGCNTVCGAGGVLKCADGTACAVNKDCTKAAHGLCRGDGTTACLKDAGCAAIVATCTIGVGVVDNMNAPAVTGAKINCDKLAGGNLTGLKLVGAFPSGGTSKSALGDSITSFAIECGS